VNSDIGLIGRLSPYLRQREIDSLQVYPSGLDDEGSESGGNYDLIPDSIQTNHGDALQKHYAG